MSEKLNRLELERKFTSEAKELKTLTIAEASYLAGLIDADGSIYIDKAKRKYTYTYTPKIAIGMTHKQIIDLCNKHGGSWVYREENKKDKEKPVYNWLWNLSMIRLYMPQMLLFFKFKKDQAQIILKATTFCKRIKQDKKQLQKLRNKLKRLHNKSYPLPLKYRKI